MLNDEKAKFQYLNFPIFVTVTLACLIVYYHIIQISVHQLISFIGPEKSKKEYKPCVLN